jgi:hypothetical protein
MAMRDVVGSANALVDAQLAADLVNLGWLRTLNSSIGATPDWLMNSPPAVVWVPTRDRFDQTRPSYRPPSTAAQLPTMIRCCWMGFEARLWADYKVLPVASQPAAEDFSAVELLRDQLIVALQKKVGGFYNIGGGSWQNMTGNRGGGEELQLGRAYVLEVEIARPVFDSVSLAQKATLVSVPMTSRSILNTTET